MATPGFISYSVDNDNKFKNALDKAKKVADDLRIPFALIASDFYRSQGAIFKLQGPGQYPDLSARYKVRKQKKFGRIYPILKANGYLEAAASIQNGPGNITEIEPLELTMGVDDKAVPHAKYHQSDDSRSKMPLRKFLFIGPEAPQFANSDQAGRLQRWLGILDGYINTSLKETGLGE